MHTIPHTYVMQLTHDDINALRRDLDKLRLSLKGNYWDEVKKHYPALWDLFAHLPAVERFNETTI